MNSTVRAILANGAYSVKNQRLDGKSIAGFVSVNANSALTEEELAALTAKFGGDVVAACGLHANDAAAAAIAAAKSAEAGTAQSAMAARASAFAPKGRELGAGIRHGFCDE